jgi:hypothetical protein
LEARQQFGRAEQRPVHNFHHGDEPARVLSPAAAVNCARPCHISIHRPSTVVPLYTGSSADGEFEREGRPAKPALGVSENSIDAQCVAILTLGRTSVSQRNVRRRGAEEVISLMNCVFILNELTSVETIPMASAEARRCDAVVDSCRLPSPKQTRPLANCRDKTSLSVRSCRVKLDCRPVTVLVMKVEPLPRASLLPRNKARLKPRQRVETRLLDDAQLESIGRHGTGDDARAEDVSRQQADGDKHCYDEQDEHDFRADSHRADAANRVGARGYSTDSLAIQDLPYVGCCFFNGLIRFIWSKCFVTKSSLREA